MFDNKHPNPIFSRINFEELKNEWKFSFNETEWLDINVPFCPESKLSGIGYTDFIPLCYYKRQFNCDKQDGKRTILHFGAVDYEAKLSINGVHVGSHQGGFTPFEFDVTDFCLQGKNELFLTVADCLKGVPSGKQSAKKQSYGCFYTRTTGIWQPVWIERVPENRVEFIQFSPSIEKQSVKTKVLVSGKGNIKIKIFFDGREVGAYEGFMDKNAEYEIPFQEKHIWSIGAGNLYDVKVCYEEDEVFTYFGLREVRYEGYKFQLNGENCYQKFVLDQGYNPEGIYTQITDEEKKRDIALAVRLGFNGSRLHQKVFDPRFLYLCDKQGYMAWGEFPSWGIDYSSMESLDVFLKEWREVLVRDVNHPSIITWCPLNECWILFGVRIPEYIDAIYRFTKEFDSTRPVVDVSGGYHSYQTDLYDFHCYENLDNLKKYLDNLEQNDVLDVPLLYLENEKLRYQKGMPVSISECGGFSYCENAHDVNTINEGAVQAEECWGYGNGVGNSDSFLARYSALIKLFSEYSKISGFCYTQLYDVEQECNGFYYYDRSNKFTEEEKDKIKKLNDSLK